MWTELIALFVQAMIECLEDRDRAEVEAELTDDGPRATLFKARVMRRILRNEWDLHGRELRLATHEGMICLSDHDAEDMAEFLDQAEAARAKKGT